MNNFLIKNFFIFIYFFTFAKENYVTKLIISEPQKCDPKTFIKKAHLNSNSSYWICNSNGLLIKKECDEKLVFNLTLLKCEAKKNDSVKVISLTLPDSPLNDVNELLKYPQFQAPDDICSGGIPLTRLSAPVICNPASSSCPDGYFCTLHLRTGTSYCCRNAIEPVAESTLCTGNQITYYDPATGLPKSCVLSSSSSCPVGFGCNLVGGSFTRCCGRNFGCPINSAGFLNPNTGAHVQCNTANPLSCPQGFICTQSSTFNTGICCSDTSSSPIDVCGDGTSLNQPNPCSASSPCSSGYSCRNSRCCLTKGLCPAGNSLGGVTSCSSTNLCPNNYQCVTSNGQQYCCPAPEHVCGQPRNSGLPCESRAPAVSRYYFDTLTGSCRAFQYTQCGGNANNFDTLEQCESFCLEAQCPQGVGLRAGPALATCSGAQTLTGLHAFFYSTAITSSDVTCPSHYSCVQPIFGNNYICCTSSEHVCHDTVTSGTPCFGDYLTVLRFHYNYERGQCEPFQYYGCNGSGNNFLSKQQCETACHPPVRNACNGVAPLNDKGDYVQRCSKNVPCSRGSWCNAQGYCCPHTETACQSPKSIGHTCLSQKPGTFWYFDTATDNCLPFIYSGCGGTPNRFASREACEQMCINKLGECPRGMTPFLTSTGAKKCSLNVPGSCPNSSSCVQSTLNEPICCTSTAQCPASQTPYVIPGSDSNVACLPDENNCPHGYSCVQSSNVAGFYMCCSPGLNMRRRVLSVSTSTLQTSINLNNKLPKTEHAIVTLLAAVAANNQRTSMATEMSQRRYAAAAPKCPARLPSNGQRCIVNEIESCPHGYLCLSSTGGKNARGLCCKAAPKCQYKRRKPYFVGKKQVLTCGDDEAGCPRGSSCTQSNIESVDICCLLRSGPTPTGSDSIITNNLSAQKIDSSEVIGLPSAYSHSTFSKVSKVVPKCRDGSLPFFALGSRVPQTCKAALNDECPEEYECNLASDNQHYCCPAWDRCPNNATPFLVEGSRKPLGCNWMANNCPEGYSCEGSKDRSICCKSRPSSAQCPKGRSAYLYAKRPLICPPGKKSCPNGYECLQSRNGNVNLCCTIEETNSAECISGYAYFDPATNKNQLCDPDVDSCPHGYYCKRSTIANAHVCCTENHIDNRYDGYCPPGQIPYTGININEAFVPPTCHMTLSPCPTTAPYQCVYSPEKQNSYCCAPLDTTKQLHRNSYRNLRRGNKKKNQATEHQYQQQQQFQQQQQLQQQQQQFQQQQQLQQQQLQYQQHRNGEINAEYVAAIAKNENGCGGRLENSESLAQGISIGYPNDNSKMILPSNAQFLSQQQQQQQYLVGLSTGVDADLNAVSTLVSQYPPTTVIDPSAANNIFVASCPPWSKPLLNPQTQLGHACSTWNRCPIGYTCYSNFPDGRNAHCCTTVPLDNQIVFRANTPEAMAAANNWKQFTTQQQIQYSPEVASTNNSLQINSTNQNVNNNLSVDKLAAAFSVQCPQGTINIGGLCKRMFFVGQQGCETDAQCNQRTNGTYCYKNYCSCSPGQLIYESKCITQCPEGFLNIAGRCHDLTTVVFMDSVDERNNGTIGGFCIDTVVQEEQCKVENSYCNQRSITCQCQPGFELQMDFGNKNDSGLCLQVKGSKYKDFDKQKAISRLLDNVMSDFDMMEDDDYNKENLFKSNDNIILNSMPKTFFVIGSDVENVTTNATLLNEKNATNSELNKTEEKSLPNTFKKFETTTAAPIKIANLTKQTTTTDSVKPITLTNISLNDTINNREASYLFQSDD